MEKVVYALWRNADEDRAIFNARLQGAIAPRLADNARAVRLNLQDEAVQGGSPPRIVSTRPQMEAVVQVWLDSASDPARGTIDTIMADAGPRFEAWLACESTAIANRAHPPRPGQRTEGFAQIVFLGRPPRLSWDAWREAWQGQCTAVAIETHGFFEYVQNLLVRPLTYGARQYAAMVEECFAEAALEDERVYFDAVGDAPKLAANKSRMMESCARFIDFDRIDCIPTSQFDVKPMVG
jgi:hypothetical protein